MIRNRNPSEPRTENVPIKKSVIQFNGMLTGEPASKIRSNYAALNQNVIDFGDYYKVRSGSRLYASMRLGYKIISIAAGTVNTVSFTNAHIWVTGDVVYYNDTAYYAIYVDSNTISLADTYADAIAGTASTDSVSVDEWISWGEINAPVIDHDALGFVVMMLGKSVYVFNKAMSTMQKVLNMHGTDPDGISWMEKRDNDVFLWSSTGMFKIVLDEDFPYMHPINLPVPSVLITDVNETVGLIYGYLYFYSHAILAGTGNRSRFDFEIKFESGLNLVSGQPKDYGEVYFATEIGLVLSETHSVGTLTLPDTVNCATHFPLYRTRNIGENSGGVTASIQGIGNRRDLVLYAADVPVAKAFLLTVAANTATLVSGNQFVRGDQSCTLKDHNGNTATINTYTSGTAAALGAGLDGVELACAIGGGRVMKASQANGVLTINDGVDTFAAGDVGLLAFVSDGTYRHITDYVDSQNVGVAEDDDFTELAITLKPLTGNFSRKWNDTVPDDPNDAVVGSLRDLYDNFLVSDMYVPRRQFKPIPNCNIGMIEAGFMIAMSRDTMRYYYSQMGDKPYCAGYYKDPTQTKKVTGTIRHCVNFPFNAVIMMRKQTGILLLKNASNVGNTEVGDNVFELPEMDTIDSKRGVNLWQTIEFKNTSLIYALTDDGAWRYFDGTGWSLEDFSYIGGKDAVSREYLKKLDSSTDIVATYSPWGGMKLWMTRHLPNATHSGTVYQIIQECDTVKAEEEYQECDSVAATLDLQEIGVING
jgi:hypothetical protein